MPVDLTTPLVVGDTATFWRRKKGTIRSQRVWVRVLEIDAERQFARVRLPQGNTPQVQILPLSRLAKADIGEGR